MMAIDIVTLVLGLLVVVPVLFMVFTSNIVRAAYAFALSLLGLAGIYVVLNAELMAVVQIMIYAGGVIVLLIFGIMLTRRTGFEGVFTEHRGVILGALFSMGMFGVLTYLILTSDLGWRSTEVELDDVVRQIGVLFLTDHVVAFELVAFLLLVALVAASFLAKKSSEQ